MLEMEKKESPGFREILEQAKEEIQKIYPGWTNFNPADSGMALLELLVFMTEAQQFHLEQIGRSHYIAFLHLLGMSPERMKPARVYVKAQEIKRPFFLPRGTKVSAGTLVFEAERGTFLEWDHELVSEPKTPFYPFGETGKECWEAKLEHELEPGIMHMLYFDLCDEYPVARNPIVPDQFIPLVVLKLQYFDGLSWRPCKILEDSTYGLLQTGMLGFSIGGEKNEETRQPVFGRPYRLRLEAEGEYDTVPCIKEAGFNVIPFVQKDTRLSCRTCSLICKNHGFCEIVADSWLEEYGDIRAYVKTERGFRRIENISDYVAGGRRHFSIAVPQCGDSPAEVCLVSCLPGLSEEKFVRQGNGLPNQQFSLSDRCVLGEDFQIWVEEEPGYFIPWDAVPDFAGAGIADRCYVLEEEEGILRFGNGRQGRIPGGRIEIVSYAVSAGSGGNIQQKQIGQALLQEGLAGRDNAAMEEMVNTIQFSNPLPAEGGKEPESVGECLQRYRDGLAVRERAVTAKDYEEVISCTPGLRIRKVKVFPPGEGENGMNAVVQLYISGNRFFRGRAYDENIYRMLEKKKMLGSSICLKRPEYIRVSLQLEIRVKSRYADAGDRIRAQIGKYFEEHMDFGKTIIYSKVFGYIDALPETAGICSLEIQAGGKGVERDDNRDIHIPFHGMPCLDEVDLRCVWTDRT